MFAGRRASAAVLIIGLAHRSPILREQGGKVEAREIGRLRGDVL